ncbi:MAG TPA: hypothetical protein VJ065_00530, partial [Patescibacteria group bacterium]|nr:hypothetical protein [Patescibacteria group bacterium]
FCYVDFMPPKVFYKGHYTQEVPEITGPFYDIRLLTHNDRAGVIYTLYINLARKFPAKRKFILAKFEQFLSGINEVQLSKHINESPFYRLDDTKKAARIVTALNDWKGLNYLILREAACFTAEVNKKFAGKLDDFFRLTHHETNPDSEEYGLLPKERFDKAKKIIIENLLSP